MTYLLRDAAEHTLVLVNTMSENVEAFVKPLKNRDDTGGTVNTGQHKVKLTLSINSQINVISSSPS